MSEVPNLNIVQQCFDSSWLTYQKIIEHDYMEHQEIYAHVEKYINDHFPQPFSLLELGCGDAIFSFLVLSATAIKSYHGVDLSATGLELAAVNLKNLNCSIELTQQEMLKFLQESESTFDIILISFALHHLSAAQKQILLQHSFNSLKYKGILLLIDVFCRDEESRVEYLTRYSNYIKEQWLELSPQSIDVVNEHITTSDFPESEATLRNWAKTIGFNKVELIYKGCQDAHKAFALS